MTPTRLRLWRLRAAWLVLGLAGLPAAGRAIEIVRSQWMSGPVTIDGSIQPAEWVQALAFNLGNGVTARVGHDARTLYVAVLDPRPGPPGDNWMGFWLEDEGWVPPILDSGYYQTSDCAVNPTEGEGEIHVTFLGSVDFVRWRDMFHGAQACPAVSIRNRVSSAVVLRPEGVSYELAIPLDGPSPLDATPGQRFGLRIVANDGVSSVCYPLGCSVPPDDFLRLILTSNGCNSGAQRFGSGQPAMPLPLDWTTELSGTGEGWHESVPFGDPVFCEGNDTAGSGATACVANIENSPAEYEALVTMPLSVEGQATAKVRLQARFEPSFSADSFLMFVIRRRDLSTQHALTWMTSNGGQVEIALPVIAGNPPVDLLVNHFSLASGGMEGGYAQLDDVEIVCGPVVFSDGFETGMTTRWAAELP